MPPVTKKYLPKMCIPPNTASSWHPSHGLRYKLLTGGPKWNHLSPSLAKLPSGTSNERCKQWQDMIKRSQQRREELLKKVQQCDLEEIDENTDVAMETGTHKWGSSEKLTTENPRRNRLALLADNINSWEDDLSHPTIVKPTEPARKTWKPPSKVANTEAGLSNMILKRGIPNRAPSNSSQTKEVAQQRTHRRSSSFSDLQTASRNASWKQTPSSLAKTTSVNREKNSSGASEEVAADKRNGGEGNIHKSKFTVHLSKNVGEKNEESEEPKVKIANKNTEERMLSDAQKTEVVESKRQSIESRRRSQDDPTKQSVAARMAAWKQKSKVVETATSQKTAPLQRRANSRLGAIDEVEKENKGTIVKIASINVNVAPVSSEIPHTLSARDVAGSSEDLKSGHVPTENYYNKPKFSSRRLAAQEGPSTDGARTSPKKLGPATRGIQEKLAEMCEGWKQNEIAEKSKKVRDAEIALLSNRWKNGLLSEETSEKSNDSDSDDSSEERTNAGCVKQPEVPGNYIVPPPPPPLNSAGSSFKPLLSKTTRTDDNGANVQKPIPKSVYFNSCPKPFVKSNVDASDVKFDKFTDRLVNDFESNLLAMGFEVTNDGTAALVDLKSVPVQVESNECKTKQTLSKLESKKLTPVKVKMTERKLTTTTFDNNEKVTITKKKVAVIPNDVEDTPITSFVSKGSRIASTSAASSSTPRADPISYHGSTPNLFADRTRGSKLSGSLYSLVKNQVKNDAAMHGSAMEIGSSRSLNRNVVSCSIGKPATFGSTKSLVVGSASSDDGGRERREMPGRDILPSINNSSFSSEDPESIYTSPSQSSETGNVSSSSDHSSSSDPRAEKRRSPRSKRPLLSSVGASFTDVNCEPEEKKVRTKQESMKSNPTDNVYVQMNAKQSDRQTIRTDQEKNVQFQSDVDMITFDRTESTAEEDGATSSESLSSSSMEDLYEEIWSPGRSVPLKNELPTGGRERSCTMPEVPKRQLFHDRLKDRPATMVETPPTEILRNHHPETKQQMAAFFERRNQPRKQMASAISTAGSTPMYPNAARKFHSRSADYSAQPKKQTNPSLPQKSVQHRLQSLQEMINQEEKILEQASNALNHCSRGNMFFVGSTEAIECHRILLASSRKRDALLLELKNLREGQQPSYERDMSEPIGRLTAGDIRLPLKPEFIAKIGTIHDTSVHYFVIMLRSGINVSVSQTVSTQGSMILGGLDVPNQITLGGITDSSPLDLEIYALVAPRDQKAVTPKKSKMGPQLTPVTPKSGRKAAKSAPASTIRASNFVQVASLEINRESFGKTHFALDGVAYACPLQGTIHMRLKQIMETSIQHRGFLNICTEDTNGWNRRWCTLNSNEINYWKQANEELYKDPIGQIDLRMCITEKVIPIPIDYKSQPDTFELVTVKSTSGGRKNLGRDQCRSDNLSSTRHWLTAESAEDCLVWCNKLNKALNDLRTWHPYAVPSVRIPSGSNAITFSSCL